ncbi:MAG TPA: SDR family oxidoreductase [Bryobacteraceae bacterium]|nr:SDR family oxidoreductase [Bryobacteraceae bacterium]
MSRTLVAITGASSGIGATFARKLAPEHDLLLIARRKDRLEQLADELNAQHGTDCEIVAADLAIDADVSRVAERIGSDPRLVLLINNAGFGSKGRFWESPLSIQQDMHKVHVMAPVHLTHAALRNMTPRDTGGIINVASVSAFVRNAGSVSYGATKSWMTSFTEGLYLELKATQSNIVVQALCPGFTYSEFHDKLSVNRERLAKSAFWLTAEEVVDASLNGLRRRRLFVIPGWRYRLLTTFLTKIPSRLRLLLESTATRSRQREMGIDASAQKQIANGD